MSEVLQGGSQRFQVRSAGDGYEWKEPSETSGTPRLEAVLETLS